MTIGYGSSLRTTWGRRGASGFYQNIDFSDPSAADEQVFHAWFFGIPSPSGRGHISPVFNGWVFHLRQRSGIKAFYQNVNFPDRDASEQKVIVNWLFSAAIVPEAGQKQLTSKPPIVIMKLELFPDAGQKQLTRTAPSVSAIKPQSLLRSYRSAWMTRLNPRSGSKAFHQNLSFADRNPAEVDVVDTWFFDQTAQGQAPQNVNLTAVSIVASPVVGQSQIAYATYPIVGFYIEIDQGNPALRLNIPAQPASAPLSLSMVFAGLVISNHRRVFPPQGNLSFSPTPPIVARSTHRFLTPVAGQRILERGTPEIQRGASIGKAPPFTDLRLSPTPAARVRTDRHQVNSPPRDLALSPTASTVARTNRKSIVPAARDLGLTPVAPVVARTGRKSFNPASDPLTLGGFATFCLLTANHEVSSARRDLALSPTAPAAVKSRNVFVFPGGFDLHLTMVAPIVGQTRRQFITAATAQRALSSAPVEVKITFPPLVKKSPPQANLVLSLVAPLIIKPLSHYLETPQRNLALSQTNPTVARPNNHWISPPVAALASSGTSPELIWTTTENEVIEEGKLTISRTAPIVTRTAFIRNHDVFPGTRELALSTTRSLPGRAYYPLPGDLTISATPPRLFIEKVFYWRRSTTLRAKPDPVDMLHGKPDYEKHEKAA